MLFCVIIQLYPDYFHFRVRLLKFIVGWKSICNGVGSLSFNSTKHTSPSVFQACGRSADYILVSASLEPKRRSVPPPVDRQAFGDVCLARVPVQDCIQELDKGRCRDEAGQLVTSNWAIASVSTEPIR